MVNIIALGARERLRAIAIAVGTYVALVLGTLVALALALHGVDPVGGAPT